VRHADDLLTEILDSSPVGVSITRADTGVVLYVNQAMATYFGMSAKDGIGMPANLFVNAEDQAKVREVLKTSSEVRRLSVRSKTPAGAERLSLFSYKLIQYRDVPAVLSWLEDETEREAILSASRQVELLQQIAGICNRAVNFFDALRKGAVEVARGLGWPICLVYRLAHGGEEVLELASMSLPKDHSEFESLRANFIGRAFRKGEDLPGRVLANKQIEWVEDVGADADLSRLSAEDEVAVLSALGVPVLVEDRVIAVLELLTDQRVARDEQLILTLSQISSELARVHIRDLTTVALQEARAEAESSARAKASFLAAMSHEVRTPMNGVVGMVDLVLQTKLDDEQRFMLQTVKDSGQALITVINDILDFSKIEAGRLEIESAKFSILKVVEDVAMSLAPAAAQKKLALIAYADPGLPETVVGDAVRVRQILSNLGSNAVKFSEHGEVVIKAEAVPGREDDVLRVRFSVRDEGLGISAEAKSRLFEEFQQADTSTTRRFGGTGLGLAICHRLATLMGGEIGVDSLLGVGSEFHCVLPFPTPTETVPERTELAGLRVLVVADSAELQKVCCDYLGVWKAQTLVVGRVRDAARHFQQAHKSGRPIDVVVIIPQVDDVRQVLALRQGLADAGLFPFPRFVMGREVLAGADHVTETAEITCVDTNPMRRAALVSAVAVAAGRASPETPALEPQDFTTPVAVPTAEEALAQGRLILVAEDHVANREVLRRQLNRLGYACDMAEDGAIALKMWNEKRYALLLTDCHMPHMDGFGLTAAIRAAERGTGRHAPIIAVTANVLQGEAERCLAAGMDAFLPKPVELRTLNETLTQWLGHDDRGSTRAASTSGGSAAHSEVDPAVLDLNRMIDSFGAIDDEVRELYGIYIDSVSPLIAQFYDEVAEDRHLEARETIHKAKGATANVGGKELAALMAEIEVALVQKNYDTARARSQDIAPAWDRLVDAIAHV
jgi:PAS domain S-box-containing protein